MQKTKQPVLGVIFATCISLGAWLLVLFKTDPIYSEVYAVNPLSLSLFFLSFIPTLTGVFTLILFHLKQQAHGADSKNRFLMISIRQGFILSLTSSVCLSLLMLDLLRVWNGVLIVALMTLVEFYLSGKDDL